MVLELGAGCPRFKFRYPLVDWNWIIVQEPFDDQFLIVVSVESVHAIQDNRFFSAVLNASWYNE